MALRGLAVMAPLLALTACGTHQSVAPVVYGSDPNSTARIYNSPEAAARVAAAQRQPARTQAAERPRAAPTAAIEPVRLQPVSAIYLSDEQPEPTYVAARDEPAKPARRQTVTVARGDTVYALGRRFDVSPQEIIRANRLRAPYHLSIGQEIRVPGAAKMAAAPSSSALSSARPERDAPEPRYRVKQGDTLYSISRATGAEVDAIASANRLRKPYLISPGQELFVPGARTEAQTQVANREQREKLREPMRVAMAPEPLEPETMAQAPAPQISELAKKASYTSPVSASDALFAWPVRGAIVANYGVGELGRRNDGINIAAPAGTPVRAAADGEVVYRGSELDGFGNLLLIKHSDGFVTAYAHNGSMIVKKGDVVRKGQVIAKVGQTGAVTTPQLHFEIRQKLKSVDPTALLEKK